MDAYFYTLFFISAFSAAAQKTDHLLAGRNPSKRNPLSTFFLICTATVLILVAGLRYGVGTDFFAYYSLKGAKELWPKIKSLDEPGIALIQWVIRLFTDDPAAVIFAYSLITIFLLLYQTYQHTDDFLLVTLLFVFTGNWHGTFNGVRQYLAAAMVFAGHRLIIERKIKKYAVVVLLAFLVHKSAIIMVIPYFILRNRVTLKNVVLLMLGTLLISANYDTIFSFIGLLKDSEIRVGDEAYYSASVSILRVLVSCAPAILALVLFAAKNPDKQQTFYINALIMNGAAMIATSNSTYLARLGLYTNVFTPLAIAELLKFKNRALETALKFMIVCLYAVFWYIEISQSGTLSNFRWVWERNS